MTLCERCLCGDVCASRNEGDEESLLLCDDFKDRDKYEKVKHGRWELEHETYGKMRCSVCKEEALVRIMYGDVGRIDVYATSKRCPNCGARMDAE